MTAAPESRVAHGPGATLCAPETVADDPYNAHTPSAALAEPVTPVGAFFVPDHFGIPPTAPGSRDRTGCSPARPTPAATRSRRRLRGTPAATAATPWPFVEVVVV
ncbi:hypothetical protein ACFQ7Z_01580 [Streptomyces virginiae]|uniref:hypothetical protein n=1 Tax=Streptomyces virginiae TaxID=1961 RepID=UPI0036958153